MLSAGRGNVQKLRKSPDQEISPKWETKIGKILPIGRKINRVVIYAFYY